MTMPATSAATCGVSGKDCHRSYRVGFPLSMYTLVLSNDLGSLDAATVELMQLIHKWPDQTVGIGGVICKGNLIIRVAFRVSLPAHLKKSYILQLQKDRKLSRISTNSNSESRTLIPILCDRGPVWRVG